MRGGGTKPGPGEEPKRRSSVGRRVDKVYGHARGGPSPRQTRRGHEDDKKPRQLKKTGRFLQGVGGVGPKAKL